MNKKFKLFLVILLVYSSLVSGYIYKSYVDGVYIDEFSGTYNGPVTTVHDATELYYSNIHNTTLPYAGGTFKSASVIEGILVSGIHELGTKTYVAPFDLSAIASGVNPDAKGLISSNKTVVKTGDKIKVSYEGQLGSLTTIDASQLDSSARNKDMTDSNYDGIYEVELTIGEDGDYNLISDCTDLQNIQNNLTGLFKLANDIDCSATTTWNSGEGFKPMGNITEEFQGILNGDGFAISNLYINRPTETFLGLFGRVKEAKISNIKLINFNITGDSFIGSLSGEMRFTTVSDISISSSINGVMGRLGGLSGIIDESYLNNVSYEGNISVTTGDYIGGIAASGYNSEMYDLESKSNLSGINYVGGFFGYLSDSSVSNVKGDVNLEIDGYRSGGFVGSSNKVNTNYIDITGSIVSDFSFMIGGLFGYVSDSKASNLFFKGDIISNGTDSVGGIIGSMTNGEIKKAISEVNISARNDRVGGIAGMLTNVYTEFLIAKVNITSDPQLFNHQGRKKGGLVGYLQGGSLNNSFATGYVEGMESIGGLVGHSYSPIYNSYAIVNVSGDNETAGFIGLNGFGGAEVNDSFAVGKINGTTCGGPVGYSCAGFVGTLRFDHEADCSANNVYWHNFTGDDANTCVGYEVGNSCESNNKSISYFQGDVSTKEPFVNWDFEYIWEETASYPKLRDHLFKRSSKYHNLVSTLNVRENTTYNNIYDVNFDIIIDDVLPSAILKINSNNSYSSSRFVNVDLEASDNLALAKCYLSIDNLFEDYEEVNCGKFHSFVLDNSDGVKTIYSKVIDLAGNEYVTSDTITLELNGPSLAITNLNPYDAKSNTFNMIFTGGINNPEFSIDGLPFQSTDTLSSESINTLLLRDGVHKIQLRDSTNSGIITYTNPINFIVDNSKPYVELILESSHNYYINSNKVILKLKDSISGINSSSIFVEYEGSSSMINFSNDCISDSQQGFVCEFFEPNFQSYQNVEGSLEVGVKDLASNLWQKEFYFTFDNVTPTITVNNPIGIKNSNFVLFNLSVNDNATCAYALDYNGADTNYNFRLAKVGNNHLASHNLQDGNYVAYYKCVDKAGNINLTNQSFQVLASEVSVTGASPTGYVTTSTPNLEVNTSVASTCKYDVKDRSFDAMVNTFSTTGGTSHTHNLNVENGDNFYFIRCKETNANPMSESIFIHFTVDSKVPYLKFITPEIGSQTNVNYTFFEIYDLGIGLDNTSVELSVNGAFTAFDVNTYCDKNSFGGLDCEYEETYLNGLNTISINVTDKLGNKENYVNSFDFDSISPIIAVNTVSKLYNTTKVVLNITVNEDSECRFSDKLEGNLSYDLMGRSFSGGLNKLFTYDSIQRDNEFHVRCSDMSGNEKYIHFNYTVDSIKPIVEVTNLPINNALNGTFTISYTYSDSLGYGYDACYISIDGGSYVDIGLVSTYSLNSTLIYDGVHTVQFACSDNAGNLGESSVVSFNIDNSKDSIYMLNMYDNMFVRDNINFSVIGPNNLREVNLSISNSSGVVYIDSDKTSDFGFYVDMSSFNDGIYDVLVTGYDELGYKMDSHTVTLNLLNSNPVISSSIQSDIVKSDDYEFNVTVLSQHVEYVDIYYKSTSDWFLFSRDYNKPYDFLMNTNNLKDDTYEFKVVATDLLGKNTTLVFDNITFVNDEPFVNITSPNADDSFENDMIVEFTTTHSFPVTTSISLDWGTFELTDTSTNHTFDTTLYEDGQHMIIVKAEDSFGNVFYDQVMVSFFNRGQFVNVLEPVDFETISKIYEVEVISSTHTKKVEFMLSNNSIDYTSLYNDSYSRDGFYYDFDTKLYDDGNYDIKVNAYDYNDGLLAVDNVNITIDNTINFTPDCVANFTDAARLAITNDDHNDLEYVNYEYTAEGVNNYNYISRAYTYPYQINFLSGDLLPGNYTIRLTGFDGLNTLVKYCNVTLNKVSKYLEVDRLYTRNNDSIVFTYESQGLNVNVTINTSKFDSEGRIIKLVDDGSNGDKFANDAIYTYSYLMSHNNSLPDGYYNATAIINVSGKITNSSVEFFVDNTAPNVEMVVNNNDTYVIAPSKSMSIMIVLTSNYSDNYAVSQCRFRTLFKAYGDWESCLTNKPYLLKSIESGPGAVNRTVFMQIKDLSGNIKEVNDTIMVNFTNIMEALNDTTAPTEPKVKVDNLTQRNFKVEWEKSIDPESFLLLYKIRYCYTIGLDSGNINESVLSSEVEDIGCGAGYLLSLDDGHVNFADINLDEFDYDFNETYDYYFKVKAINGVGLINVSVSNSFKIDDEIPSNVTVTTYPINTYSPSSEFVNGDSLYFEYGATDNNEIAGYYVVFDHYYDTNPKTNTLNNGNITFTNVNDGDWYFHVAAVDKAGNVGNTTTINFSVDRSRPSTPVLISSTRSFSDNISINFSESKDLESGIETYVIELSDDESFSYINETHMINDTNLTIVKGNSVTYYVRVKAINKVNISSLYSDKVMRKVDKDSPIIISEKESGFVVNSDVKYVMRTDEEATCYYVKSQVCPVASANSWKKMEHTNGFTHGQIFIAQNTATYYCRKCVDPFGNHDVSGPINFTKINSFTALSAVFNVANSSDVFVGDNVKFNLSVYDSGIGIGELDKDELFVEIDGPSDNIILDDFSLVDYGAGNYELSFIVPQIVGIADVNLYLESSMFTENINITDISIDVSYSENNLDNSLMKYSKDTHRSYAVSYSKSQNDYYVGIATDSYPENITSDSDEVTLNSRVSDNGYTYMFISRSDKRKVESKVPFLKDRTFDDQVNPSFGGSFRTDSNDVNVRVEYSNYIVEGLNELQNGFYELKIRKIGVDPITGKPIIFISSD